MDTAPGPRAPQSGAPFGGKPVVTFREEHDRRNFLRNALLVGVGATYVATQAGDPLGFTRPGRSIAAEASKNDLDILNYALTLEYLEAAFYDEGLKANILEGRDLELVTPIRDHENEHVKAVTATITGLGGTPVAKPQVQFPEGTFADKAAFLKLAGTFEELGVKAYHGQVPLVQNGKILAAAASIAGVESRHAAIIADLTGGNPFPSPIEGNLPMAEVLAAAKPFIVG